MAAAFDRPRRAVRAMTERMMIDERKFARWDRSHTRGELDLESKVLVVKSII